MAKRKQSAKVDLTLRIKEPLRADLAKTAKQRGVSMNAEIVNRLERSSHNQSLLNEVLDLEYGKRLAGFLLLVGRAMNEAGMHSALYDTKTLEGAKNWLDNAFGFDQAVKAAQWIFEASRPTGVLEKESEFGVNWADSLLDGVAGEITIRPDLKEWTANVRDMLGPMVDHINRQRKGGSK